MNSLIETEWSGNLHSMIVFVLVVVRQMGFVCKILAWSGIFLFFAGLMSLHWPFIDELIDWNRETLAERVGQYDLAE